jgi:hypothetical protein
MKKKLHHIVLITCLASAAFIAPSYAQEAGIPDLEASDSERDKLDREKIINSPGEGDSRYVAPRTTPTNATSSSRDVATKDSVRVNPVLTPARIRPEHPTKSVEKAPPSKQEDDSILSFNFLYYIIQKYKLQDIVD